jgi:Uma2 family endonuclease
MATQVQLITADELLTLPRGEFRYELVKGELKKMSPAGHEHGAVIMQLAAPLAHHVRQERLGRVYAAETGFKLATDPDTVRAPDIAFITQDRVEQVGKARGYWPGAPDLAVEVLSPDDRVSEIEDKISEWLRGGSRQVWVVSPQLRTVTIYFSTGDILVLTDNDRLEGGDVVPGFQIQVNEIFT